MIRWTTRIVVIAIALMLLGMLPAPKARTTAGPYGSALASVGAGTAWATKPNRNCNSYCEFIAPGYHCLNEGVNEKCVTGTSGCSTVACP